MKTSLFDFDLPDSLIAAHPVSPRDAARMLVVSPQLQDACVRDLAAYLKPGDVMVFNDTKVIPARLLGRRGDASIEIMLHKQLGEGQWQCFARPGKKLKPGDRVMFAPDFYAEVVEKLADGQVVIAFNQQGQAWRANLEKHGHMPLPPYIDRPDEVADKSCYQTVYAREEGSVVAPTAGLHFTESLLAAIDAAGIQRLSVTLHVGGGTFLPVKVEDTNDHIMHSEWAQVSPETARKMNEARRQGGRVIAVGTTALRTLESAADEAGILHSMERETDIFITPGYHFKIVDMLLTNFHLPRSTLFMLTCAFAGMDSMVAAYRHAITRQYRFYSYGDACLLSRS